MFTGVTLFVTAGCVSHSELGVLSNKGLNLGHVQVNPHSSKGRTQSRHCHYAVLFFTIGEPTDLEKALDEALREKRAKVLLNADVNWQFIWIPFLYTQECWKVEGDAYDIF